MIIPPPPDPRDHYRKCLLRFFNRNRLSPTNPDAAFFYGFTRHDLDAFREEVPRALAQLGRPFVVIDCFGKTSRQIYAEAAQALGSNVPGTANVCAAADALENALLDGACSLVLQMLSASKASVKPGFARGLIKLLDDAHFRGIRVMSDVIFIDRASFLEKAWPDIGAYLRPIGPFDNWIEWMDKLDEDTGHSTLVPVE